MPPGGEGSLLLGADEVCAVRFRVTTRRGVPIDINPLVPEMQTDQVVSATYSAPELSEVRTFGADQTTVLRAPTRMTTQATPRAVLGQSIVDVATVEGGVQPTGTVTFFAFGPDDPSCTGFPKALSILNPLTAGPLRTATSAPFTPLLPGTYRWIAAYGGDASNQGALGVCGDAGETSLILAAPMQTSLSLTAEPEATLGQPISAKAALVGGTAPTGTITFALHRPTDATCAGLPLFSATVLVLNNGNYSAGLFVPPEPGTYRWTASYSGDAINGAVTTVCGGPGATTVVAAPEPPTTTSTSTSITTTTTTALPPTTTSTSTSSTTSTTTTSTIPLATTTSPTSTTTTSTSTTTTTSTSTTTTSTSTTTTVPPVTAATTSPATTTTTVAPNRDTEGDATVKPASVRPGQSITVSGRGYAPQAPVTAVLLPEGLPVGAAVADATGCAAVRVALPTHLVPGQHLLHLVGLNPAGGTQRNVAHLTVRSSGPSSASPSGLPGLVLEMASGAVNALVAPAACPSG